ncbi:MAG: hypothetical protein OFPII_29170 [Osedax symbiont Rs1]|nr:MAG: hypothetical protein OFPII_29170 [Osedax symbiont Rs1]
MDIRLVEITDAAALLVLFAKLDTETEFMLYEPGERKTTLAEQEKILTGFKQTSNKVMLIAEKADQVVGFCLIVGHCQARVSHVGSLVIGIVQQCTASGLGSQLMALVLTRASEMNILRIELNVSTNNYAAIALYKKFAFKIEGEKIAAINLNGILVNEYSMARVEKVDHFNLNH